MKKKVFILGFCFMTIVGIVYAEELSTKELEDKIFWSEQVNTSEAWGFWLKEVYRPYSDKMTAAMLKIVTSPKSVDPTGKSSEEILEEVTIAYNASLKLMKAIKPPVEFKAYHKKVIEYFQLAIDTDPSDKVKNALKAEQLSREMDKDMTKALKSHGVPDRVINHIIQD